MYGFFGATADMWIGKLWPRGRAAANGLSSAKMADNFCAQWSGGRGFLEPGEGSEVSIEPAGSVYPCCLKTRHAIGSLREERLEDMLASLRGHAAFEAINRGEPQRMGETFGWSQAEFLSRSRTRKPDGGEYANLCIGCDRFHDAVLGPEIDRLRESRLARARQEVPA